MIRTTKNPPLNPPVHRATSSVRPSHRAISGSAPDFFFLSAAAGPVDVDADRLAPFEYPELEGCPAADDDVDDGVLVVDDGVAVGDDTVLPAPDDVDVAGVVPPWPAADGVTGGTWPFCAATSAAAVRVARQAPEPVRRGHREVARRQLPDARARASGRSAAANSSKSA